MTSTHLEESNTGNFSMREIPRPQFAHCCRCWQHILLLVQQLVQVIMNSHLLPVSQAHHLLSQQLLTSPENRAYLRVKLGQLFFIKVELFVHSLLVSELQEENKEYILNVLFCLKIRISIF